MNIAKKMILPGTVVVAGLAGVAGSSLLTSLSANAASDTSGTGANSVNTAAATTPPQGDPSKGGHTANGITEAVLTGDTATKAIAAAKAAVSGGTVVRAETDAEGAAYEVHMTKSDGSQVTVKLDSNFKVTGTEDGMGKGGPGGSSSSSITQ